ncbi:hypothetical protein [Nonomuraea turkmeniaca]|uniref:hypothetical protein n=1 Tax=Nonomuraea turkmeniaca TaxID=103838 RepID=UPI001FE7D60C|nr:hypothetical protein [Nonomuraea turkmeniaca]
MALASVFGAPPLQRRVGSVKVLHLSLALLAVLQIGIALSGHAGIHTGIIVCTILSGIPIGLNNTVFTESAMEVSDAPRPVASAGYNFVRWMGGALAPFLATKPGEEIGVAVPYALGAACCLVAMAILYLKRHHLSALVHVGAEPVPAR